MLERLTADKFLFERWRAGSLTLLGIHTKFFSISENISKIRDSAIGYIEGKKLWIRPKTETYAVMFFYDGVHFWTHLTTKEFYICFPELKK